MACFLKNKKVPSRTAQGRKIRRINIPRPLTFWSTEQRLSLTCRRIATYPEFALAIASREHFDFLLICCSVYSVGSSYYIIFVFH